MRYTFTRFIIAALLLIFCLDLTGQVELSFQPPGSTITSEDTLNLDIQVSDFDSIVSFQFSIQYDTAYLEYLSVNNFAGLTGFNQMSVGNPGAPGVPLGIINLLWVDFTLAPNTLPEASNLISIKFLAKGCGDHEVLFSGEPNAIEFLKEDPPGSLNFINIGADLSNGTYINECPIDTCEITALQIGEEAEITCFSALTGPGNDSVEVAIQYTGADPAAVIVPGNGWTIGPNSNDPTTEPDGTIYLSGGMECDSFTLAVLGDSCNLMTGSIIPCEQCDTAIISTTRPLQEKYISSHPIYPNPFTNFATLPVELLETCHLSLRICDVSGKNIRIEQQQWAKGAHQLIIKRNWFPKQGLYFLTLMADHEVLRRDRLIVME